MYTKECKEGFTFLDNRSCCIDILFFGWNVACSDNGWNWRVFWSRCSLLGKGNKAISCTEHWTWSVSWGYLRLVYVSLDFLLQEFCCCWIRFFFLNPYSFCSSLVRFNLFWNKGFECLVAYIFQYLTWKHSQIIHVSCF